MTKLSERIERGKRQHGDRFDPVVLERAHSSIKAAYEHGQRVRVTTRYPSGEEWTRTGTVSTTTGWQPCFLLMSRSNAIGSSDTLEGAEVVAVKRARGYVGVMT